MLKLDASLLNDIPPFSRLSSDQIREILDQATPQRWDEGATVFRAGDEAERFFLLLDGTIRVVRTTPEGEQIVPLHIPRGQLFGIAPALSLTAYPASAVAAEECLTLCWPSRLWQGFVARYDGFASETWRTIGERMQHLHDRVEELATRAVEQRIAAVLLQILNQSGRKVKTGIEIPFPITRATIAEMTGTTLHTVSRLLSAWEKQGIVASSRKHITVTDPHRLVLISGSGADQSFLK
ncbi:Crp/Fnr family transcriptional regulator [Oceanibium sediminis]|uniref:Crp/Fnr family transcriptional regulator n=1 Tax=Oceanibium sediminis TaxID=2026339 RepID=UPI000DD2F95E|nr:Crp/Fnr family transcriptional regulator [Oceanibium sediminis]